MTKDQQLAINDRSQRFQALFVEREKTHPHESYHDRFTRVSRTANGAAIWAEADQAKHATPNSMMMAANSYNPAQPRDAHGMWTDQEYDTPEYDAQKEHIEKSLTTLAQKHGLTKGRGDGPLSFHKEIQLKDGSGATGRVATVSIERKATGIQVHGRIAYTDSHGARTAAAGVPKIAATEADAERHLTDYLAHYGAQR